MKKTLICFNNWQDFYTWQGANGSPRVYRNNGFQRVKINTKLFIILCISWTIGEWYINKLRQEHIVGIIWLGNTKQVLPRETIESVSSILPFKFAAAKALPERDMSLHGLGQFHSLPVHVRTREQETIDPRKAWYMFAKKNWVYAGTTDTIDVVEWYAPWYKLEAT